jgi:hypothetical protein
MVLECRSIAISKRSNCRCEMLEGPSNFFEFVRTHSKERGQRSMPKPPPAKSRCDAPRSLHHGSGRGGRRGQAVDFLIRADVEAMKSREAKDLILKGAVPIYVA